MSAHCGRGRQPEQCGLAAHNVEVAGGEVGQAADLGRRLDVEPCAKCALDHRWRHVAEGGLEHEPSQRGAVQVLGVVRRACEGQGMGLHPGEHLVDLADLPLAVRAATVGEEGIGLVED